MLPKTLTGLTKINFDARMTEKPKNLATKRQVENGFDLRDKNIVKIKKIEVFDLSYYIGHIYLDNDGSQNYSNQFVSIFKFLLVLLIKSLDGNLKVCQKEVLELMLHQKIVLIKNLLIFIIKKQQKNLKKIV